MVTCGPPTGQVQAIKLLPRSQHEGPSEDGERRLGTEADLGSSLSCVSLADDLTPESLGLLIYKKELVTEPTSEGCLVG